MRFLEFNDARAASVEADALVDDTIDRYVDWREACRTVRTRYEGWSRAPTGERIEQFTAYRRALDREDSAAQLYAASIDRLTRVLWPERVPALRAGPLRGTPEISLADSGDELALHDSVVRVVDDEFGGPP